MLSARPGENLLLVVRYELVPVPVHAWDIGTILVPALLLPVVWHYY